MAGQSSLRCVWTEAHEQHDRVRSRHGWFQLGLLGKLVNWTILLKRKKKDHTLVNWTMLLTPFVKFHPAVLLGQLMHVANERKT